MALWIFVFLGLFTPGPNIVLLAASAVRFGFQRSLPHVLGVAIGVGIIAGVTGLGLSSVILALPGLTFALKIIAAGWILWMAWGLISKANLKDAEQSERPFTFFEAVLFQWVNPKIWALALAASAGYSIGLAPIEEAIRLATAFSVINLFVCLFWTLLAASLSNLLHSDRSWLLFRRLMGFLLAASAAMVFF